MNVTADTYEDFNPWTQKYRTRCAGCNKVVYPDEATAKHRAAQISERVAMRHYKGKKCGHWHVTRKKVNT